MEWYFLICTTFIVIDLFLNIIGKSSFGRFKLMAYQFGAGCLAVAATLEKFLERGYFG